jgi:Sec7-like guanine-nucleotide exchange factor
MFDKIKSKLAEVILSGEELLADEEAKVAQGAEGLVSKTDTTFLAYIKAHIEDAKAIKAKLETLEAVDAKADADQNEGAPAGTTPGQSEPPAPPAQETPPTIPEVQP